MSDVPETPDGAAEATQGVVEHAAPETTTPPWGDDFQPEKAWGTIENLRRREKELEQSERELKALRSDPDRFREFASQHGYEFEEEPVEEPVYDEGYDPVAAKVDALEQKIQQQEIAQTVKAIESHIDELASSAGVKLTARERQLVFQQSVSDGQPISEARTEQTFRDHVEWVKQLRDEGREEFIQSKRAPTPPPTGTSGEPQFDHSSPAAREARMAAIIQARMDAEG